MTALRPALQGSLENLLTFSRQLLVTCQKRLFHGLDTGISVVQLCIYATNNARMAVSRRKSRKQGGQGAELCE